jgi:uncharacterized protein with HEPN domain
VKDDRFYLIHILERIQRIESYTTGGREAFLASSMIQDAVIRNFEIIGEAAKQVSESFRSFHPGLPWRRLAGFRDVLIHNYPGVDLEEVWNIITGHLPVLREGLKAALQDAPAGDAP